MNYFYAYIYKCKKRNKTYLEPKKEKKRKKKPEPTSYTEENPSRTLAPGVNNSEVGQRWGIVSHAASSTPCKERPHCKAGARCRGVSE